MTLTARSALVATLALAILWTGGWTGPLTGSALQDKTALTTGDPPTNGVWIDSLDLSNAPIRRPRAGRGQMAPRPR